MREYFTRATGGGVWDCALLAPVAEINEQLLEQLRHMASEDAAATTSRATPRLVSGLREQWRRLDGRSQGRLAACPYLLMDGGFSQAVRWERALADAVMDTPARSGYFAGHGGTALIRRMLVLAWHLARSNRLVAAVALGMSAPTAERLASTRLRDLECVAEVAPSWILPRWEHQHFIWHQLIAAACAGQPLLLRQVQLRGLQLMAGECTRA